MIDFKVNGKTISSNSDPQRPLLWVLREDLELTGTKFGCGIGQCGACTVLLDGEPIRSCVTPVAVVSGRSVTSVEGLVVDSEVIAAWRELSVPQCGYCQSGQLMAATALLRGNPDPDDRAIDAAMDGQLCRCGTYPRIRAAIKRAVVLSHHKSTEGE